MAVRFASVELADHFVNIANGLEIFYAQCDRCHRLTMDDSASNMPSPPVVWYRALLNVTMADDTRSVDARLGRLPLGNPGVLHRAKMRSESMPWQVMLPGRDFRDVLQEAALDA